MKGGFVTKKTFDAELTTIEGYLTQHTKSYLRAPAFQRQYVWDKENVTGLLSDAAAAHTSGSQHFLGSLIRTQLEPGTNEYLIIDGQQRLTTITLTLLAAAAMEPPKRQTKLLDLATYWRKGRRYLRWIPTSLDTKQLKLVLDDLGDADKGNIEVAFPEGIRKEGPEKGGLWSAYKTITEYLQELGTWKGGRQDVVDGLLKKCAAVDIVAPEGVDATQIFASINGTGKPLGQSDLVRNFVFQRFGANRQEMEKFQEKYWEPIDGPLTNYQLHEPFFQNLAVQHEPKVTARRVFKSLSTEWGSTSPVKIAKRIQPNLEAFLGFAAADGAELDEESKKGAAWRELSEAMIRIRHVNDRAAWPYLLPLLKNAKGGTTSDWRRVARCVRMVESLFIRRLLGGRSNTQVRYFFLDLYEGADVGSDPDKLKEAIRAERDGELMGPTDSDIRNYLRDTDVYVDRIKKGPKYLLETFERVQHPGWSYPYLLQSDFMGAFDHIMPQNPPTYKKWGMTKDEYMSYVNKLGNLVLIDKETNLRKSNTDDWKKIIDIYTEGPVQYTRCTQIASKHKVWGANQIRNRTNELVDWALTSEDGWKTFE